MLSYCLNCKKYPPPPPPPPSPQKKKKSKSCREKKWEEKRCYQNVQCGIVKNQDFFKEQEAIGLLRTLGIKAHLSKIPLLVFFCFVFSNYKMND